MESSEKNIAVDATETLAEPYKYWAFISYSSKDRDTAIWLIKNIEAYRIPSTLVGLNTKSGRVPRRLRPVFRDRDELRAGSDLKGALDDALNSSKCLIAICSPNSAADSSWVNKEIEYFRTLPQGGNVIPLIAAGEPNAALRGEPELECFPLALRRRVDSRGDDTSDAPEPLAADLTREDQNERVSRRKALLKIIAAMINVDFDDLEQRDLKRRRQRMLTSAISLFLVLALIGAALAQWYLESIDNSAKTMAREAKQALLHDPEFAALLSLRSFALSNNAAAYDSLIAVASSNPHFYAVALRGQRVEAAAVDAKDELIAVASCADQSCKNHHLSLFNLRGSTPIGGPVRLDVDSVAAINFHPNQDGFYVTANYGDRDAIYYFEYSNQGIAPEPDTFWAYNNQISDITLSTLSGSIAVAYGKWNGQFKYGEWNGEFMYGKVQVLDAKKVPICTREFHAPVVRGTFSADDKFLAVVVNTEVHVIDLRSCTVMSLQTFDIDRSGAVAFEPLTGELYSVALDSLLYQINLEEQTSVAMGSPIGYSLFDFYHRMDVNANYLASKEGASVHLVNIRRYTDLQQAARESRGTVYEYIGERELGAYKASRLTNGDVQLSKYGFSPSGETLYTIDKEGTVSVWRSEPYLISEKIDAPDPSWRCSYGDCEDDGSGRERTAVAEDPGRKLLATLTTSLTECGGDKKHDCLLVSVLSIDDVTSGLTIHTLHHEERTGPLWERITKLEFDENGKLLVANGSSVRAYHLDISSLLQRVCAMAGNRKRVGETDQYLDEVVQTLLRLIGRDSTPCS